MSLEQYQAIVSNYPEMTILTLTNVPRKTMPDFLIQSPEFSESAFQSLESSRSKLHTIMQQVGPNVVIWLNQENSKIPNFVLDTLVMADHHCCFWIETNLLVPNTVKFVGSVKFACQVGELHTLNYLSSPSAAISSYFLEVPVQTSCVVDEMVTLVFHLILFQPSLHVYKVYPGLNTLKEVRFPASN